jgi:alanine-glyoxylate transaminase/serine-glyoxylate transaminase/serine-pyruvate transaminase
MGAEWHPYPTTLPTQIIMALRVALLGIVELGLETHFKHFSRTAVRVREGLGKLGFEMYLRREHTGPMVTAFRSRQGVDVAEMVRFLRDERDIVIAQGIGELGSRVFRVGHMGLAATDGYADALVAGLEVFLL